MRAWFVIALILAVLAAACSAVVAEAFGDGDDVECPGERVVALPAPGARLPELGAERSPREAVRAAPGWLLARGVFRPPASV